MRRRGSLLTSHTSSGSRCLPRTLTSMRRCAVSRTAWPKAGERRSRTANASLPTTSASVSISAVAELVRGASRTSAISPKKSARCRRATCPRAPSASSPIATSPETMRNIASPSSPFAKTRLPASKSSSVEDPISQRMSDWLTCANSGVRRRRPTSSCSRARRERRTESRRSSPSARSKTCARSSALHAQTSAAVAARYTGTSASPVSCGLPNTEPGPSWPTTSETPSGSAGVHAPISPETTW